MKTAIACAATALVVVLAAFLWHGSVVTELENKLAENAEVEKLPPDIYPMYWVNIESYQTEVDFYVRISDSLSLQDKLQSLADRLSRHRFNRLPINVVSLEAREGKTIAVVNLGEHKHDLKWPCLGWVGGYFEGSAGGTVTSRSLVETFLQRDYSGEWIDGVEFLYKGSHKIREFDHIKLLYYTSYREQAEP